MTANPEPNRDDIEKLKASVDLVSLLEAHGVAVKKLGRAYKALCPFHSEDTPSLSVDRKKGLYHCFGCGESGDHLSFLQRHLKLTFPEALAELRQRGGQVAPTPQAPAVEPPPFPYELLARVAEVWHQAFCERHEGLAYLEKRGLKDKEMLRIFRTCLASGHSTISAAGKCKTEQYPRKTAYNLLRKDNGSGGGFDVADYVGEQVCSHGQHCECTRHSTTVGRCLERFRQEV